MMVNQKQLGATLLFVLAELTATGASAITAEVAKKCESLTAKAFPPRQIGNPSAIADGKMDDSGSGETT